MFLIDCSVVQTTQFLIINLNLIKFINKKKIISDLLAALTMHGLYKRLKFIKHLTF